MKRVLFIDPVTRRPYRLGNPDQTPPGGTEATVLRVSQGLAEKGYEIWISQQERTVVERDQYGIIYIPFTFRESLRCPPPDAVVCLRSHKIMPWLRRTFKKQPLYLWLHCFPGTRRRCLGDMALRHNFTVITVSRSHACFVEKRCGTRPLVLYNPLRPGLESLWTDVKDPDTLIFFSSPHKGLGQVLESFQKLRAEFPKLTLKVANPGYIVEELRLEDGVIDLGALPHERVLREVASSFCVFYPQTTFAETFGLVFAEANAVGTPVLTHDLGSASEILSSADQLVDCNNPTSIIERFTQWREFGSPRPRMDPRFKLANVLCGWEELLRTKPTIQRTERLKIA